MSDTIDKCVCDSKFTKAGEYCTNEVLKSINIYNNDNDFKNNNILDKKDIPYIDRYINNEINKSAKYSFCTFNNEKTKAYKNCAINNPWLTLTGGTDSKKCSLPLDNNGKPNIELPNGFSYDETDANKIKIPKKIYKYNILASYCQERWYDWFTIPDYHLGNKYTLVPIADLTKPFHIQSCRSPCRIGYIPKEGDNENCIPKKYYKGGKYENTINYLPISLILLLGSTKDSLKEYYKFVLNDIKDVINNNNLELDTDTYNNLYTDDLTFDKIYTKISAEIKPYITSLINLPIDVDNILVPDFNTFEASKKIIYKSRIQQAYNICKNLYDLTSNPNKSLEYLKWRTELAKITDPHADVNKATFKKQMAMLKKACNVTFDGKSEYSKDYILYSLNKDISINEVGNLPIELTLSSLDKQYNLIITREVLLPQPSSKTPSENPIPVYKPDNIKAVNKDIELEYKFEYIQRYGMWIGFAFAIIFGLLIFKIILKNAREPIMEIVNIGMLFFRNVFYPIGYYLIRQISIYFGKYFGKEEKYMADSLDKDIANFELQKAQKNYNKLNESIANEKINNEMNS